MIIDNLPIGLHYKVERLGELIDKGRSVLNTIGKEGNIDQHDLWFSEAHSFLATNCPEFLNSLNSIAKKYANDLLGEYGKRAAYHLIQEQIEVLCLARGHFMGILKASPDADAIYALIDDKDLKERCADLLTAAGKYDRVVNQATLILEDRIRRKSGLEGLVGVKLVNKALNSKIDESILKLSDDPDTHEGIGHICRGIILSFRNPTHHGIIDKYPKGEALKLCAFIDNLLSIIDKSSK